MIQSLHDLLSSKLKIEGIENQAYLVVRLQVRLLPQLLDAVDDLARDALVQHRLQWRQERVITLP